MATFKTMEQVLEAEVTRLEKQAVEMACDLCGALSRVTIMGGNIRDKYQATVEDMPAIRDAISLVREIYPSVEIPSV